MKTTERYKSPALIPLIITLEHGFAASQEWGAAKDNPSFDEGYEYDL